MHNQGDIGYDTFDCPYTPTSNWTHPVVGNALWSTGPRPNRNATTPTNSPAAHRAGRSVTDSAVMINIDNAMNEKKSNPAQTPLRQYDN